MSDKISYSKNNKLNKPTVQNKPSLDNINKPTVNNPTLKPVVNKPEITNKKNHEVYNPKVELTIDNLDGNDQNDTNSILMKKPLISIKSVLTKAYIPSKYDALTFEELINSTIDNITTKSDKILVPLTKCGYFRRKDLEEILNPIIDRCRYIISKNNKTNELEMTLKSISVIQARFTDVRRHLKKLDMPKHLFEQLKEYFSLASYIQPRTDWKNNKPIKDKNGKQLYVKESRLVIRETTLLLNKKSENTIFVKTKEMDTLIEASNKVINNPKANAYTTACALIILSGRRCIEVLKQGEIKLLPKDHALYKNHVVFTGQAKLKTRVVDDENMIIPIATDNIEKFVEAWYRIDTLRNTTFKPCVTHKDFNNRSGTLRKAFKKYITDLKLDIRSEKMERKTGERAIMGLHNARALYFQYHAKYSKEEFNKAHGTRYNMAKYGSVILGHSELDIKTTANYNFYEIIN